MVKIKYRINEYFKQIYVVIVPNNYTRAMLFLRVQEFYESKSKKFRDKSFSFWDYKQWYSSQNGSSFTYTKDWSGFNFPLEVAVKCQRISKMETPYDEEMNRILKTIKLSAKKNSYIIGVGEEKGETFKHEMAHALYHTNLEYRKNMDILTVGMDKKRLESINGYLASMGYCRGVLKDEIQAYISTGEGRIFKGIKLKKQTIEQYSRLFNVYYNALKIKLNA